MPPGDRWQTAHSSMFNGGFGGKRDTSSDSKRVGNKQQETATSSDNFAGAPHPSMDTMGDADDYYLADYAKTFSFQSSHPPSHHNYLPRSSRRFDPTNYQTHIQASQDLAASTGATFLVKKLSTTLTVTNRTTNVYHKSSTQTDP
ncbi:predicted protein [Sclerotinia sclerotiorum 1980 UF-70]|uniref:Uncharacterized protein n=1 Tax=Sclerotinia sclerotiorum (strain ATCC 18683 / 1980 / Ss-1) TaxID=665079 RepID=A7EU71_SCLS1|nr:predicted protein [Sclerotinia sclerotiorum 1980 UF-70]EDN93013.1 predicted protein [Sclerotinia sclerotiorum 1980 UF-70]